MNYLVAGLGNIGAEYAFTRHNMGFMVLDAWAQASDIVFRTERYGSVAVDSFKGRSFYLLKPSTYMNLSGKAIAYWMQKLDLPLENLLVIHDDISLPFGTLRMRKKGSSAGHNGLENIEQMLGTSAYARIKMGIGSDYPQGMLIDYVLGKLPPEQLSLMPQLCEKVIEGAKSYALAGPDRTMNSFNSKSETL